VLNVPLPGSGAIAQRRPIPQMSQFNTIRWDGWAKYHALTAAVKRRFAKGLTFDANWTWSHSIDDASDPGTTLNETNLPQNVYDMATDKASSSFDHPAPRRHELRLSISAASEFARLGAAALRRLADRRLFHGTIRGAVYSEHRERSSQHRARSGAEAKCFGRSQPWPETSVSMVRHVCILASCPVQLWKRAA